MAIILIAGCSSTNEQAYTTEVPATLDGPPLLCKIILAHSGNFSYDLSSSSPFEYLLIDLERLEEKGKDQEWVDELNQSALNPENELEGQYLGTVITGIIIEKGQAHYNDTININYIGKNGVLGISNSNSTVIIKSNRKIECT
ncbi:hypothetical protein L0Y65_01520 [Candidatus Micrarchaeota archaeon]|nr:hypothetical protein [Candidatus Micrarchaeota archaeon]